MKRKALLAITGCTPKAFETYSFRGFLPFVIEDRNWSNYTIYNAFSLKVLLDAAASTDLDSAAVLAKGALDALHPINPFAYSGEEDVHVALIRYDWPEAPEDWDCRTVVAGRWGDIEDKARKFVAELAPRAHVISVMAISATKIARSLLAEARDFGMPEGEVHQVPEDLTGYPEWFQKAETSRRAMLANWGKSE